MEGQEDYHVHSYNTLFQSDSILNIHRQLSCKSVCLLVTEPESTCSLSDHPSTKNTKGGIQTSPSRKQQLRETRT